MRDEDRFHEIIISIDWDHFWFLCMKEQHRIIGIEYCVYVSLPVHFAVRKEKLDILEWLRLHAYSLGQREKTETATSKSSLLNNIV